VDELQIQLDRIVKLADARGVDNNPVGILSADDRDVWAKTRVTLLSTGDAKLNEKTLEKISSAMFIVCLDDESPISRRDVARHMLHGGRGTNRFWDKSFQLAVTANGKLAYTGEHSMTDGMTTTRFVNYVLDRMFKDPDSAQAPSRAQPVAKGPYVSGATSPLAEPEYLPWGLSKETIADIKRAEATFSEMSASKEFEVLMFYGYGADKIKTFGCSPDAFAQLALQLAYRKTFGHCRGTYESTQTRTYMHGRTEVTRSVSIESEKFCDAVLASKSKEEIHAKLIEACKAHSEYIGKASKGMGCDRHLLALKFLIKEGEKAPSLYSDPGYTRSNHWAISTSGLVGELMDGWCFGEVVPDGIGVGYSVQQKRLRYSITSRHPKEKWAQRVCQNLEDALTLMGGICEQFTAVPSQGKPPKAKL
jgi:carnitine O-acetyltransferase